jgi:hypothetical protein
MPEITPFLCTEFSNRK